MPINTSSGPELSKSDYQSTLQSSEDIVQGDIQLNSTIEQFRTQTAHESVDISTMTPEQAIKMCDYLSSLALHNPELAQKRAEEYMSDPAKISQLHPEKFKTAEERGKDKEDALWDSLAVEFAPKAGKKTQAEAQQKASKHERTTSAENPRSRVEAYQETEVIHLHQRAQTEPATEPIMPAKFTQREIIQPEVKTMYQYETTRHPPTQKAVGKDTNWAKEATLSGELSSGAGIKKSKGNQGIVRAQLGIENDEEVMSNDARGRVVSGVHLEREDHLATQRFAEDNSLVEHTVETYAYATLESEENQPEAILDKSTETQSLASLAISEIEPLYAEEGIDVGHINAGHGGVELDTVFLQAPEPEGEITAVATLDRVEIYTDEQLETLFDPDTLEVYKMLLTLMPADEVEPLDLKEVENPSDIENVDTGMSISVGGAERNDATAKPDFVAFIAMQPIAEEPISLEMIQDRAKGDKQSLDQTFIHIVRLLRDSSEEDIEGEWQSELRQVLKDIESVLPACSATQETGVPRLRITPELTEKLLMLLQYLGYEHPKEALVDLLRKYGFVFLLQALLHICQLNSDDYTHEFLTAQDYTTTNEDEDARLRIGRLLFGFITRLNLEFA